VESKTLEAELMESYTFKAQELTIDVPEASPVESTFGSTIDAHSVVLIELTVLKLSTLELSQLTL
jgi:hypothetical protein